MSYGKATCNGISSSVAEQSSIIVDLRSDTISRPSRAMKLAMLDAELGDDVYREDPTVIKLEKKAAALVGKEAAIFVTSGTMGNLIAIMNHCDIQGSEAYCGDESHVVLHEQGGAAQIAGVSLRTLPNEPDGTFDLKKLESKLRNDRLHEPISKLIIVENTLNGKIIPQSWIVDLVKVAKKHDLKLHMDGARLWNASVASKIPAKDIVAEFDSVTFCLSKGLGAPVGSMLCGTESFIANARRVRKVLGGGMRQAGILAAAGLVAINEIIPLLEHDHRRAYSIMKAILDMNSKVFVVDPKSTQTNMIFVNINSEDINANTFVKRLATVLDDHDDDKAIVKGLAVTEHSVRFVLYYEIMDKQTDIAIRKIRYVITKLDPAVIA